VIRWITDSIGTAAATSAELDDSMASLDVRDLVDKGGNPADGVKEKIDQGLTVLREGKRVVVLCDYGISRSNAIAAGILSRHESLSLEEAVTRVRDVTGEEEIKLEVLGAVRDALDEGSDPVVPPADPRVLITGGRGFVGAALLRELPDSAFTIAPSRDECDLLSGSVALDLLAQTHRVNRIVHLANPRVYTSTKAIGEAVTMLRNALDVARQHGATLIYLSSWEVFSGYRSDELVADETLPIQAKGPYGEAKMLCEQLLTHFRKHYGVECVILRSPPVYGPGSDRPKFIHTFIDKAQRGESIATHRYRNGPPKLDLLHVDDLARGLAMATTRGHGDDLHFGSGRLLSTHEVAQAIVSELDSPSTVTSQAIDDYAPNIRMDHTRATHQLGWRPTVSFDRGLSDLLPRP
jgi:nucleoside-diphosphate-sugar epimerase